MMHFDRRFLVVVGVSMVWALLVAGAFYRLAGGAGGRTRAASLKQVVVAIRPLPVGSTVDAASITLRGVPDALFPAGAFSRVADVLERPVIRDIQADEPVIEARVAAKGSGGGLGPLIPPGMRAISVRVNDVVGVAGFVLPGMRVDVLVTGKASNGGDTETQTVLQNIAVLSAGQTTQTDGKSQPIVVPVVTLLVSPVEAEALTLANSEGHIQLVLRNSTDRALSAPGARWLHELYGAPPAEAAPAVAPSVRVKRPPAAARPGTPPVSLPAPVVEPDRMIVIQGSVKKVEIFAPERSAK
jgi:pilus assembly protein CpaB